MPRWHGFVVVPENRSAVRAARALARAVGRPAPAPFAPLVFHGPPGTGKSHLARALADELAAGPHVATSQTVPAADLARASAVPDAHGEPTFADPALLACDLLVLEDVHHLPARAADAAADLLDRRSTRRKATVITALSGPASLIGLPRRLTSRLSSGLVVQLEPFTPAGRRAVASAEATARGVRLTSDALDWLASRSTGGGVRPLLGTLAAVAAQGRTFPGALDRSQLEHLLTATGDSPAAGPSVEAIVKRVAAAFGVTEKELLGPSRLRRVLVPRQVAMYLSREVGKLSYPRVGALFGGRDHTTVLHACRKVEAAMSADERLAGVVRQLRAEVG